MDRQLRFGCTSRCRSRVVQVQGSNTDGLAPTPAAREMSRLWWTRQRIRSGWVRFGRDRGRDHRPSSRCAWSPAFDVVALAGSRGAVNPGAGAYRHDARLRRATVIHRHPRHFRGVARRPMLGLIRTFGLISTDAAAYRVSVPELVRVDSRATARAHSYAAWRSGLPGSKEPGMMHRDG